MKFLFSFLFICTLEHAHPNDYKDLFAKPLVLGASVSAGYGTSDGGPATVLAKKINSKAEVDNRAIGGATSVESTKSIDFTKIAPSIVMAFDLFFWDAARNQCGNEFERNTRKLFKDISKRGIPMMVGLVPVGVKFPSGIRAAGARPCTAKINKLIDELCTEENSCIVYDAKNCFDRMSSSDSVRYFSDRLHTTDEGNKFCAEAIIRAGEFKKLL